MKKQPRATYEKVSLPPTSETPSKPLTPITPPPTAEADTPEAIAEDLIPIDHLEDPDYETADLFVWHYLFREVIRGNVSAMRVWIQSRREANPPTDSEFEQLSLDELKELDRHEEELFTPALKHGADRDPFGTSTVHAHDPNFGGRTRVRHKVRTIDIEEHDDDHEEDDA